MLSTPSFSDTWVYMSQYRNMYDHYTLFEKTNLFNFFIQEVNCEVAERYQPPPRQPAKLPLKPEGVERILLGYSE